MGLFQQDKDLTGSNITMGNIKIQAVVDMKSLENLCSLLSLSADNIKADKIVWKAGNTYKQDGVYYVPVKAIGYRFKNQSYDEELREVLGQSSSLGLSGLCAEQFHTEVHQHPLLEIQSNPFPDGTPLLHTK